VKQTVLTGYDHQNYTYGRLVRELALTRDPARLPLTEIQFNLERVGEGLQFDGLSAEFDTNPKRFVNFDIFLNIIESKDGLLLDCDYNTGLFDEATIVRWLGHYEALLEGMVADVARPVSRLPLLTANETEKLLVEWNHTGSDYPRDKSVVALFEQQAAEAPHATALVFGEQKLSYRELNERANSLAHHLRKLGVGNEEMVACCLERSADLIITILGILKAGAAYVPIDPALPRDRLQYMLDDSRARVMITQASLIKAGLKDFNVEMIAVDDPASPAWAESKANRPDRPGPEQLAYVMYTSGSTGRPKGVMVEHRAIVRLVKNTNYCQFGPQEVFIQFAPISFDASTFEIWGALLNGGRLVIMPPQSPSLDDLGRTIRENGVTTLWLTAGLFHVMVEQHLDDLRGLRQLLAGGDVLSPWHVRKLLEEAPSLRLINGYGPTEGTTFTCCHRFAPEAPVTDPVPIGRPISNTRIYLLDATLQPVPIGRAGELFIAGDGLARGYLNNPELTAEKYLTWTTPNGKVERLYRTGDQARFLPDGAVQFLGRRDNQVKLRGFRIELDEIEAVMRSHPDVRQACIVADRQGATVSRLIAYCVPAEKGRFDEAGLRTYLRTKLPPYMIPAVIVPMESLPLTANGKVDRSKLPSPEPGSSAQAREYVAPDTSKEKLLADIVSEVLGVKRVGVTDDLFELGADSLRVFQVTSRAVKAGLGITPRQVMQFRAIRAVLSEAEKAQSSSPAPITAIKRVAREKYRVNGGVQS
jgi:amino acid adenylation domain-containing protein